MKLTQTDFELIHNSLNETILAYSSLSARASTEKMANKWDKEAKRYIKIRDKVEKEIENG